MQSLPDWDGLERGGTEEVEPKTKEDFLKYVIPEHRTKLLEIKHKHRLDDSISFLAEPHLYVVNTSQMDGDVMSMSVTGLASLHREPFDSRKTISLMKRSKTNMWPRKEYVNNLREYDPSTRTTRVLVTENGSTIGTLSECKDMNFEDVMMHADRLKPLKSKQWYLNQRLDNSAERKISLYSFDSTKTDEEIETMWKENGTFAANKGTYAHYQMERFLNREKVDINQKNIKQGIQFLDSVFSSCNGKAYRTEWEIFAIEEHLAGSIDLVMSTDEGYVLVDWKCSDKLEEHMRSFAGKRMKEPFSMLEDCDGMQYALQLSIYRWILQKYYNINVVKQYVCSIHEEKPYYTDLPYLEHHVSFLMRCRREWRERLMLESETHKSYTCSRCKRLPIFPVSVNGSIMERSFAIKEHLEYEDPSPFLEETIKSLRPLLTFYPTDKERQVMEREVCFSGWKL